MSCPFCSHTMQNLGLDAPGRRVFWCPRCGTLKTEAGDGNHFSESPRWASVAPEAVEAARDSHRKALAAIETAQAAVNVSRRLIAKLEEAQARLRAKEDA